MLDKNVIDYLESAIVTELNIKQKFIYGILTLDDYINFNDGII